MFDGLADAFVGTWLCLLCGFLAIGYAIYIIERIGEAFQKAKRRLSAFFKKLSTKKGEN